MKPFLVWLLFPIFLLTACSSTALIDFQDYRPEDLPSLTDDAGQNGVNLRLWGIHALSKDVVFLYGSFNTSPGTLRSVLLRSRDGGRHWKEVMQPERGSEITELFFLPGGQGWAVALWTVDGPGRSYLFHSDDSGAHWKLVTEFPQYDLGWHSFPSGLQFLNAQQGSVRILSIVNLACCNYETDDGGLTWQKTDDCLSEEECLLKTPSECSLEEMSWKYGVSQAESTIKISRRLSLDGYWTEVSKIPLHYGYKEGKIVLP
jgi:photosystem II stability/assembly factor-like uncharacterized protein